LELPTAIHKNINN